MHAGTDAVKLIKHCESLRLRAYYDIKHVPTIGWGHTQNAEIGMVITQDDAERFLRDDLEFFTSKLNRMLLRDVSQNQFDALLSWIFNVGENAAKKSTLIRKLNFGVQDKEVADEFLRWNKAVIDGVKVVVKWQTERRAAERELFLSGHLKV